MGNTATCSQPITSDEQLKNKDVNWDSQECNIQHEENEHSIEEKIKNVNRSFITASKNIWQDKAFQSEGVRKCKKVLASQLSHRELLSTDIIEGIIKKMKMSQRRTVDFAPIKIDQADFFKIKTSPIQNEYSLIEEIGSGSYGKVFKAKSIKNGQLRAVKKLNKKGMSNADVISIVNEYHLLKKLDHPNVIKLYDMFKNDDHYYVVTELCEGGSLLEFLAKFKITQILALSIAVQVLTALNYLHGLNILHRDIKLQNIVIVKKIEGKSYDTPELKIIDFGLSQKLKQQEFFSDTYLGTLIYMPPEGLDGILSTNWDIWSLGIMLFILLTNDIPYQFDPDKKEEVIEKILNCDILWSKCKGKVDKQIIDFLRCCLKKKSSFRSDASKLLQHSWIKKYQDKKLTRTRRKQTIINFTTYENKNNLVSVVQSYISSKQLHQKQRQQMAQIFNKIDQNKNGFISRGQLKSLFQDETMVLDDDDLQSIFSKADKNHSDQIQFNQFITIMKQRKDLFDKNALEQAFQYFNEGSSKNLSKTKINKMLKNMNADEVEYLFKKLDQNEDEIVQKQQFVDYLLNCSQRQYTL